MGNADHTRIGAEFQNAVKEWFEKKHDRPFILEKKIAIGNPPKDHKFDIADSDGRIVIECKRYTWTKTGNVPSGKIRSLNEAAFYLSFLPDTYDKFIAILYSTHPKRAETLAEYYHRSNRHLLGTTKIAEFNLETQTLRIIDTD